MGVNDVESEVDIILARASIFNVPLDISDMTICPAHRSSLGIGWRRGSQRCRVPAELSRHAKEGKSRKADRGINKALSRTILRRTGINLVPRVSLSPPPRAREERPWSGLVTCVPKSGTWQINVWWEEPMSVNFVST